MKDNKWINNRINTLLIGMSFLMSGDTNDDNTWMGMEAQCILLKEMLD